MVGMSGKASEPRGGTSGSSKKQQPVPGGHNRAQPPQEALQMARILDDSIRQVSVSDLDRLITAVLHVASGRSSEDASIALHDNNFDVEKAITVLLDTETGGSTGEWTTTGRNRKRRDGFKSGDSEQIVAPGDTKTANKSRGQGSRGSGTNKAAAASTREAYGGGVAVSAEGGPRAPPKGGRGTGGPGGPGGPGGRGQDGRGRSQSGRRPTDKPKGSNPDRDRRREKGNVTGGERAERNDRGDRSDRNDHGDRGDRSDPADRGDIGDRGDRVNRSDRGDRGNRGNRDDRGDRNDRGNRGDRGDRPEGQRERRDRGEERRERGGDDRRDRDRGGDDRRDKGGDNRRERDRGGNDRSDRGERDRGNGYGRKGRQRQRDRTEKQWDTGSSQPATTAEGDAHSSTAHVPGATQFGSKQKQAAPAFQDSWTPHTNTWETPQDKEKAEVISSHSWEQPATEDNRTAPLFPDALPTSPSAYQPHSHSQLAALSTAAETTPSSMSVGEGSDRALLRAEVSEQRGDQASVKTLAPASSSSSSSGGNIPATTQRRAKRLARSKIPTTPVEMPGGVETLDLQFGHFGIDFIGLDQPKEPEATPTITTAPVSTEFAASTERPNMYNEAVQRLADDPSVLSVIATGSPPSQALPMDLPSPVGVAQSYSAHSTAEQRSIHRGEQGVVIGATAAHRVEAVEARELEGPPGLPRPAAVPGMDSSKSSQSLPSPQQQQQQQHLALSVTTSISPSSSATGSSSLPTGAGLGEATRNSSNSVSIQMQTPEPLEMPHQQSSMASPHLSQSHYQVTSATSDLLISSVTLATTSTNMPTSVGMASGPTSTSSSHLRNSGSSQHLGSHGASSQHSSMQQQQQISKQLPAPAPAAGANMMYHPTPMNVMQYPFGMMPMYAAPNYPDPTDINRQFPVSLPYYASSEHSLAPTSTYGGGAMADHSKYGRGSSDGSTPVTSQQQQQHQPQGSQQGGGSGIQQGQHLPAHFMNYPYPPFYSAPMYHMPHGGFSAPHNMAPKPSGTASNLSSYQHQHQHHGASSGFGGQTGSSGSYEDMISGGGSTGSTSHDQFSSKMYGSSLSKSAGLPTTGGDVGSGLGGGASSAFTKHSYEGSKSMGGSAAGGYNYGLGNQQYLGYMGMPIPPHHMATAATQVMPGGSAHDNSGGGVVTRSGLPSHGSMQKHGSKSMNAYQNSGLWSQNSHS